MFQRAGRQGRPADIGTVFLYLKDFTATEKPRVAECKPVPGNPFFVFEVEDEFVGVSLFVADFQMDVPGCPH